MIPTRARLQYTAGGPRHRSVTALGTLGQRPWGHPHGGFLHMARRRYIWWGGESGGDWYSRGTTNHRVATPEIGRKLLTDLEYVIFSTHPRVLAPAHVPAIL